MDHGSESLLNDSVPSMISNKCILANSTIIKPKSTDISHSHSLFLPNLILSYHRSGLPLWVDWIIDPPSHRNTRTRSPTTNHRPHLSSNTQKMDGCERREAEKELEMQEELKKKKKKCERNRIGRSNYLVVSGRNVAYSLF